MISFTFYILNFIIQILINILNKVLLGDRFNIKKVEKKSERKKGQRKITEWNMPLIGSFEDFGANKQIVSYEQMNE